MIKGRSCQGHRNRVSNHHYYTLDKGGRQVIGNYDLERGREWYEVTGADSRHAKIQFDFISPRSGVQKERAGFLTRSSPVEAIHAVHCGVWRKKEKCSGGPLQGGFSMLSGTPVLKAQLLLGPTPVSPRPSPERPSRIQRRIRRRSTRLQKKSAEKAKIVDIVDSSEEDHTVSEVGKIVEGGCSFKMAGTDPLEKGPVKGPDGTPTLIEELRCHLKVLNGLGGSLSNTCACINLLTLEITNYLREVVKNLKDLSAAKEQQKPAGKEEEN
eukprot:Gb_25597 [translate_table: standard]